jgi:diacylglycerol O-acyltransferase / wax synthase
VHPAVPVPDGHGITIGAISYAGRVGIGLTADAAVAGDLVEIARDLETALDGLRVTRSGASTAEAAT